MQLTHGSERTNGVDIVDLEHVDCSRCVLQCEFARPGEEVRLRIHELVIVCWRLVVKGGRTDLEAWSLKGKLWGKRRPSDRGRRRQSPGIAASVIGNSKRPTWRVPSLIVLPSHLKH
jgi:hypothetical protein